MFGSFRLKNIRISVICIACTAVIIAVCLVALRAGAPDTVSVGSADCPIAVDDEADITAFISACGCENAEMISDTAITVPEHWNAAYTEYNEMQLSQGFDLTPYKGKSARELVFRLSDSPELLYLLLCDDKIVAAHICSYDGSGVRPLISD